MSKYLKILLINASYLILSAFVVNAQNSESEDSQEKEESEELKLSTRPQLLPNPNITSTDADLRLQIARFSNLSTSDAAIISNSGVSGSDIAALGSASINSLIGKLDSTSTLSSAVQFKTLVEVIDAFSNAPVETSAVGRRAISSTVDISKIVDSTVENISTDHLLTLEKLDVSHMSTFATDGVANIENFTTRVDVTSAMVGDSLDTLDTSKISTLVDNLHNSLDADSLTALKSLEKSHMATLVGSGDKKIDLTASFDASTIKKSVKKFATKAEVTVTFAKKAGGTDLSGVDLSVIATQIHTSLDDDHLTALQNLSIEHMDAMMPDASALSSGLNVSHIAHVATKAEVVVEFAKASAGTTKLNDDGTLDFGKSFTATNMKAFVTTVHTHISEDMTKSLALFDPEHMATLVPTGGTMDQSELEHFGTKAQVGATYFIEGMSEDARKAMAQSVASKVHTLDKDMTGSFKKLTDHSTDISFSDIVGNISLDKIHHAGAKAKKTSTFISGGHSVADLKAMADDLENHVEHLETLAVISQSELVETFAGVDIADANSKRNQHNTSNVHYTGMKPSDARAQSDAEAVALHNASPADKQAIKDGKKTHDQVVSDTTTIDTPKVWSDDTDINTAATAVATDAKGKDNSYTNADATVATGFPQALEASVTVAEELLKERRVSSDNDLGPDIKASDLMKTGYNSELIRLMVKYGAIGKNGSTLADAVLGSDFTSFSSSIKLDTKLTGNTKDYLGFLAQLGSVVTSSTDQYADATSNTGAGSSTRMISNNKKSNNIYSINTSNITIASGSNVIFNNSAEIDSSDVLAKGDRRLAIIGAAKDMTIKGSLNIKNTNKTENGALVLGAADDLYFRSEYSATNSSDYNGDPNVVSITNEGANLALGSEDTMRLVNVSISTGGNLAIGTLNELHIGTSTAQQNTLSVGTGGYNSDPDNIYLYAHNLIQVNGLNINGRVDDIYMEAITINLQNVNFPSTSEVTLRSRDGTIGFNQFATPIIGGVNMTNVKHGSTTLEQSSFNGGPGYWATKKTLPNYTPAVQIKKF